MWFAKDFHSWLHHSSKSLANHLTRDQKIVIHGYSCIILYILLAKWYKTFQLPLNNQIIERQKLEVHLSQHELHNTVWYCYNAVNDLQNLHDRHSINCPSVRVRYGVLFVTAHYDLYTAVVTAVVHAISCYIEPFEKDTGLFIISYNRNFVIICAAYVCESSYLIRIHLSRCRNKASICHNIHKFI